ncbi:MAG: clostripain-related cysteine peptidase [Lachnospiraceae bacterium]|nr:clostripain-related cysteine peptidase [Lachnospiraceae bacterium]
MKKFRKIVSTIILMALLVGSVSTEALALTPKNGATMKSSGKKNTLMIYMVGSDLESKRGYASMDIIEMMKSGVDLSDTNIVIYAGGSKQWHLFECTTNMEAVFEKKGNDVVIKGKATSSPKNMGEAKSLTDFLDSSYKNYPAEHYSLVLWDHGSGPLLGYGSDELFSKDGLRLPELDEALAKSSFGKGSARLDWIGFDACLMSTIETATILSKYTDYMIASEELEPGNGWDYTALKILNSTSDPQKIGKAIIDSYTADMNLKNQKSLSMLDLSEVRNVNDKIDKLFVQADNGVAKADQYKELSIIRAKTKVFAEGHPVEAIDLGNYAANVKSLYKSEADDLEAAINKLVVYQKTNINNANGVSIYYPNDYSQQYYYNAMGDEKGKQDYLKSVAVDYSEIAISEEYNKFLGDYWCMRVNGTIQNSKPTAKPSAEAKPTDSPKPTATAKPTASPKPTAEAKPTSSPDSGSSPSAGSSTSSPENEAPEEEIEPTAEGYDTGIDTSLEIKESQNKDQYVISLSKEQKEIFQKAQINVYMKTDKKDYYEPVIIGKALSDKANGEFEIAKDQPVITLETEFRTDIPYWPVGEIATYDTEVKYRTYSTALEGPYGAGAWTKPTGAYAVIEENMNTGKLNLAAINYSTDKDTLLGKNNADLTKYDYISYYSKYYKVTNDKNGNAYPFEKWEKGSTIVARQLSLDSEISVVKNNTSKMEGEFVGQFVWTDIYGNKYGSKLLDLTSLEKPKSYSEKKDGANLTYSVYDNFARLDKIDGSSNKLAIPDKVSNVPVEEIGSYALKGKVKELVVPGTIKKLDTRAFEGNDTLEKITLEEGIEVLPDYVVSDCENLTEVKLPNSLKVIGKFAFSKDKGLKKLEIPKSVVSIGSGAFEYCHYLKELTVAKGNSEYKAVNDTDGNVLFTSDGKKLVAAPGLFHKSYDIPNGTEEIQDFAFSGSYYEEIRKTKGEGTVIGYGLCEINFPASLRLIGDGAFFECNRFKKIELPDNLEVIGIQAFGGTDFTGYGGVTSYEKNTIELINIGPKVEWVGQQAFDVYNVKKFSVDSDNQYYYEENGKLKNKMGFPDEYSANK